jgi:O-antigen/teichoic acid export membrane protein
MSMTSVRSRAIARQRRAVTSPAVAAALAQLAQAAGSFVLQVVAAHALGARGLGVVSLCLGVIILVTAVTSGLVGDSLTVLDRHEPSVRAALQGLTLVMVAAGSTVAALALNLTGILDGPQAVAFAVATAVFQLEEVLRRVLMASLRFWTLLVVDGAAVVSTLVALAVLAATGEIEVGSFLVAIAIGQSVGIVVAALVLPVSERRLVRFVRPAYRQVLSFGGWRGAQVALTPLGLTASRLVVLSATGAIALGEVEAARVLGAPALLVVQGLGAYLLSTYARDRGLTLAVLRRRARRASVAMAGTAVLVGAGVALVAQLIAPVVIGREIHVDVVTVIGWAVFAAATATMQPFTSLAVARGHQRAVLFVRCLDVAVGVGLLAVALGLLSTSVALTPFILALGPVLGGVLVRVVVLRTPAPSLAETS